MIGARPYLAPALDEVRELYALAYLEGLQRHDRPEPPAEPVRLDTPDRAPIVRYRSTGGDRG